MTDLVAALAATPQRVRINSRGHRDFDGVRLGRGSTHKDTHTHPPDQSLRHGERCSGCRWSEATIYWSHDDDEYVVSLIGRSELEGEVDRVKTAWCPTAAGVLEALLVVPPKHLELTDDRRYELQLPPANAMALEEAARLDPELDEVRSYWLAQREHVTRG